MLLTMWCRTIKQSYFPRLCLPRTKNEIFSIVTQLVYLDTLLTINLSKTRRLIGLGPEDREGELIVFGYEISILIIMEAFV